MAKHTLKHTLEHSYLQNRSARACFPSSVGMDEGSSFYGSPAKMLNQ